MRRRSTGDEVLAAQTDDLAFLQGAEQLALQGELHFPDLIQKKRALMGQLEESRLAPGVRAGEGSGLVAEQLAFQKTGRHGGAIEGDEGPLAAPAMVMDALGKQFLAGA